MTRRPPLIAPKPTPRPGRNASFWRLMRLMRRDLLSALPAHLFQAKMATFRTPFFRSFLINQPDLVARVLRETPDDFPKSARLNGGLRPLLGHSVFVATGADWARQRRIVDLAFGRGGLGQGAPAMCAAARAVAARPDPGPVEVEALASHATADIMFRTLFSVPIDDAWARQLFEALRTYQRAQPLLNPGAFLSLPGFVPRLLPGRARRSAKTIRALISDMVTRRQAQIAAGNAPDDLATRLMTTPDPDTGRCFSPGEMVDQVAIFLLAGHETSAAALAWSLYLLASDPDTQVRAAAEARALPAFPDLGDIAGAQLLRNVFREALRLYPPVPMMVRQAACPTRFRDRDVPRGAQVVISLWHLHRHRALWDNPDAFCPARFADKGGARDGFLPFSAGPRVCPGAGFAMLEGPLLLAAILRDWALSPVPGREPVPVAHLTLRARDGIWVSFSPRDTPPPPS